MKNIYKNLFIFLLVTIATIFAITVYLFGINGNGNIFATIGANFSGISNNNTITNMASEMVELETGIMPQIHYVAGVKSVGDMTSLDDMFDISFVDQTDAIVNDMDYELYLSDVTDNTGSSVLAEMTTEEISKLEEIPAAVLFDYELNEVYFCKSGNYKVYIDVYLYDGSKYAYEFKIPVETR